MTKEIKGKEGIDFVVCQICYRKLKKITNTHLSKHNMKKEDYQKKYPNKRTEAKKLSDYRKRNIKNKTYKEQFGEQKAKEIINKKRKALTDYGIIEKKCKVCGQIFSIKENIVQEYCSLKCKFESQKKGTKIISCLNCKKEMVVGKNFIRKFCCDECSNIYKKENKYINMLCRTCGKEFLELKRNIGSNRNGFCSKECKKKFQINNRKVDYRRKTYLRLGKFCSRCNTTKNLLVHHIDSNRLNDDDENLTVLCRKCHSKLHLEMNEYTKKFTGQADIENGTIIMLNGLRKRFGLDISDVNFRETPKRVARAYEEIFEGINSKDKIKDILSKSFPSKYSGMIIVDDIVAFSMCPHHFLPVEYRVSVGYISKNKMLGISKLARLVEMLAKQPILQETFTANITKILTEVLKAEGAIAVVNGRHMCMRMRGVKAVSSTTTTSSITGIFKRNEVRQEFMQLAKKVNWN